jgi:hypothetical protein
VRYWDSSALVALFVEQQSSGDLRRIYAADSQVVTWTLSDVEIRSALCRLTREGAIPAAEAQRLPLRIEPLWESARVVTLVDAVKTRAKRLLGVHSLRAADSLQLGAALAAVYDNPVGWEFVCLDDRLSEAARREGFTVVP